MSTEIVVKLSNRHIHLTEETKKALFGNHELNIYRYLNKAETLFAYKETVTIYGPKGKISGVRVLGPLRKNTQAELLKGDCYTLGVECPVMDSVDPESATVLAIEGPEGHVKVPCGIIARRHIHMGKEFCEKYGLKDRQIVDVQTKGERSVIFRNVLIRCENNASCVMHIDTEEGNAAGLISGETAEILV